MFNADIWKYCTSKHCKELILSFQLLGNTEKSDDKVLSCLYAVSNRAEAHYRPIAIEKHNGEPRNLFAPDPLLKKIQTNILHHVLDPMPISPFATAYRKGTDILQNATPHIGQNQVLKLDIENFFGSIVFPMIYARAFPKTCFPPAVATMLTHLCCCNDVLPQGAPTSAAISNLVMNPFDEYMGNWCATRNIIYTRYCDDMTFSGDFNAYLVKSKVCSYLGAMGFVLNEKKAILLKQQNRQSVTGIVVNTKPQVSKQYRKNLRREIYYCTKFGVISHLTFIKDQTYLPLGQKGVEKFLHVLLGKINFILHINPQDAYFRQAKNTVNDLFH